MLNNLILVGRVCEDVKLYTNENGYKVASINLAVQRPFKNQDDVYDTDFIPVKVTFTTAEISSEYLTKGSIVGVKGRVSTKTVEIDGKKIKEIEVIGERVSFISIKPKQEKEAVIEEK